MLNRPAAAATLVLFTLGVATVDAATVSFEGLGDLPGGDFYSEPRGVADGASQTWI